MPSLPHKVRWSTMQQKQLAHGADGRSLNQKPGTATKPKFRFSTSSNGSAPLRSDDHECRPPGNHAVITGNHAVTTQYSLSNHAVTTGNHEVITQKSRSSQNAVITCNHAPSRVNTNGPRVIRVFTCDVACSTCLYVKYYV